MFGSLGRSARLLFFSFLLWGIGEGLWIYIQPRYIDQLGAVIGLGWLVKVAIYMPAGRLADRFGVRRLMLPAWIVGTVGVS